MALDIPPPVPADFAYAVEWIHQKEIRLMIPSAAVDLTIKDLVERRSSPGNSACYEHCGFSL
jgi:hypothetical protein